MASEMMSEVLQIPDGKHKEWIESFVIDLVSANGRSEYTKRIIEEAKSFRKKKAAAGSKGGKKSKRGPAKDDPEPQAELSSAKASLNHCSSDDQAISISKELRTTQGTKSKYMTDENGYTWNTQTGEEYNPFDEAHQ